MTARNGLAGDEVVSALQRSIRRGKEKDACEFAYETYITSLQFEERLWRHLLVISVEDISMGDPIAALMVNNLNMICKEFQYNGSDRTIFSFHATHYLCGLKEDRSSDPLKDVVIKSFVMEYVPETPDIALDKHATRGQEMGRESEHLLHEASKVIPQAKVENYHKKQYEEVIKKYDPNHAIPNTFVLNPWQV